MEIIHGLSHSARLNRVPYLLFMLELCALVPAHDMNNDWDIGPSLPYLDLLKAFTTSVFEFLVKST